MSIESCGLISPVLLRIPTSAVAESWPLVSP